MEHVDEENVRRKDLHMSTEASVTGTSAECADGTLVLLEGAPHEMRNEPQNSLRATPRRLPIEGEPCECEQEVANGVVTAGRTNGTAGMAKPIIADVDRTVTLGKDLATVACGVDEGNKTERNKLRLQQTNLFCEKANQCNKNANRNLPSAHGLPLEGEWTVYPSGETTDSRTEIELEGCEGGASEGVSVDVAAAECCQQLGTVDSDPGREDEHRDALNELMQLLTQTAKLYVESGGDIPRVYLRGTRMWPGNANGPGSQMDGPRGQSDVLKGQADRPRGWTDTLSISNSAETAVISHGERVSTDLGVRDAKRPVHETDGAGTHAGTLTGQMDAPSIETKAIIPTNATENVRTT